jgi:CDP-glucose 4,6-dehydratase
MGCESLNGESFNFGPRENINETVGKLIWGLKSHWPGAKAPKIKKNKTKPEAGLLRLDCSKAKERLGWQSTLDFDETVAFTADWYREFCGKRRSGWDLTIGQIEKYTALAQMRKLPWAQ